ncbi:hypothetical protein [Streptacidiphilus melanogenes]|nr:hypothetical protein [Streptacidiphilus melanogenes]
MSQQDDQQRRETIGCHPLGLAIGFVPLVWALLCLITSIRW